MKRTCKSCSEQKPIEEFVKAPNGYYQYICKICLSKKNKIYYLKNKKHIDERCTAYYHRKKENNGL